MSYLKYITGSTFTVVIGMKNDEDIFYERNDCESINDDGKGTQNVLSTTDFKLAKGTAVYIKRASAHITIDNA